MNTRHRLITPGRIVGLSIIWALAALLAVVGVLDLAHCLLAAACLTAVVVAWPRTLPEPPRLPMLPHHSHLGARRDLADLSWSATDPDGRVSAKAVRRVRALADISGLAGVQNEIEQVPSPGMTQVFHWLDSIDEKVKYD